MFGSLDVFILCIFLVAFTIAILQTIAEIVIDLWRGKESSIHGGMRYRHLSTQAFVLLLESIRDFCSAVWRLIVIFWFLARGKQVTQ